MACLFKCFNYCFGSTASSADNYLVSSTSVNTINVTTSTTSSVAKLENPFIKISKDALSLISSYFSVYDAVTMQVTDNYLRINAEYCIWRPLIIRRGIQLENKIAKEIIQKEEYFAYHKFNLLASIHGKSISISDENIEINFEKEWKRISQGSISYKMLKNIKIWVENHDPFRKTAIQLVITGKSISRLPINLSFPNLTRVDLSYLDLDHSIPNWIFRLPKLSKLCLKNMKLTALPSKIVECTNLNMLDIGNDEHNVELANHICELPSDLCKFSQLIALKIDNLNLISLPSVVCQLTNLQALTLANNCDLGSLPDTISNLKDLSSLCIANIGLKTWPRALLELKKICILEINNNEIKDLPIEFRLWFNQLTHLKLLGCNNNPWDQEALHAFHSMVEASKGHCQIHYI